MLFDYEMRELERGLSQIKSIKTDLAKIPDTDMIQSVMDKKLKEAIEYCFDDQFLVLLEKGVVSIRCELGEKFYIREHKLTDEIDSILEAADEYQDRLIDIAENFEAMAAKIRSVISR